MGKPRPQPKKVELEYNYDFEGKEIDTLTMRPPKVQDTSIATTTAKGKGNQAVEIQLFANLTDTTSEFINDLEMEDYQRIQEAYTDFLPSAKKRQEALLLASLNIQAGPEEK